MDVAILTVGDELLSGETENTNATWLARSISERGGSVECILAVGDDEETIADAVETFHETVDAVVVSGGLGGTHDDVTLAAVAAALDRDLVVDPDIKADVEAASAKFVASNPDLDRRYDLDLDVEAWSKTIEGGRTVENPAGLSPGCVAADVYVLPGVPSELQAVFEQVADDFAGDRVAESVRTDAPESALIDVVEDLRERFPVTVGIYPGERPEPNRVTIRGTDPEAVHTARDWLAERIDLVGK